MMESGLFDNGKYGGILLLRGGGDFCSLEMGIPGGPVANQFGNLLIQ